MTEDHANIPGMGDQAQQPEPGKAGVPASSRPRLNDATDHSTAATGQMTFPVGYHRLHPDTSLNFQMNRWFGCVGEPGMLEEMGAAAPRIATYADWTREFVALAEGASEQGHVLRAGFYWRSAEFFMRADDPARENARERFLGAVQSAYSTELGERFAVPYYLDGQLVGQLSAYRFTPSRARGTIVFFGGFDSYIEEMTSAFLYLRDAGYDVIAFDGPGQGRALHDGLPLTPEWHAPIGAVLDHFGVERVTLIGLSLGGCLALRAAAAEPRVARVVAFDALTDFLDVVLRQTSAPVRRALRLLLRLRAARGVNWMVARAARRSPVVQWGIEQGMHVTRTSTAFDFLRCVAQYRTTEASASIRQDVLLLAGRADHYVPVEQWRRQIEMLEHARSISARLFTADEHAENHCQVGNQGLALRTIVQWLDGIKVEHSAEILGNQGDVLVAKATSPIWTPLLGIAAAAVTEVGGPFAHAAIVAREFGIPLVGGATDATRVNTDGAKIVVDGTAGIVEL